tara:strand:- start:6494 stop:7537 length:1044 start_codon:yes stop_codon:yes gene_type:complete
MSKKNKNFYEGAYSIFPQSPNRFPREFLEESTSFTDVLNKVVKDSLKPLGLDSTVQTVGTVLKVVVSAKPYPGGFRDRMNEIASVPTEFCLQMYVHTKHDSNLAVPKNLLDPGAQTPLIYQHYVYEAANISLDSVIPSVGDQVMVIHPFAHGFLNPVGVYLGPINSDIPTAIDPTGAPFSNNIVRIAAVPYDEADPDDECFENQGQGSNCAWKDGKILGKVDLESVPTSPAIKYNVRVRPDVAQAFKSMVSAAQKDGINVGSVSGFRTYKQQADAHRRKPNLAVAPGKSNHQQGIAIDIDVKTDAQTYRWLSENAHKYGFARTVSYEPWHWVYFGVQEAAKRRPAYT